MPRFSKLACISSAILAIFVLASSLAHGSSTDDGGHVLVPGDAVYICSRDECTFRATTIRPDGEIVVPLIGELLAASLTASQLAANINAKLARYVNHPDVRVVWEDPKAKSYYVDGMVHFPGEYTLATPVTVLDAINKAGGPKKFSDRKRIVLLHKSVTFKVRYRDLLKHPEKNMLVENGDHILIP